MAGANFPIARLLAGSFFLLLGACATPQTQHVISERGTDLPRSIELVDVPFYPQESHQCGPASLAMAISYAGVAITPQHLTDQVYLPQREGSLQVEMLAATRRHGLLAYELAPSLSDVLSEVAAGTPVLVLQNLAFNWYPFWHYAVVVGYDLAQQQIVLRSGLDSRQVMSMATFERTWARSHYWAMVAVQPDQLPKTAQEERAVKAVVALESAGRTTEARAAYNAALARWPDNLIARIGLGNIFYKLGDLPQAENAFREATLAHPESAAAYNNLAQALADQDKLTPAMRAAKMAVELGGSNAAIYRETLEQIIRKSRE